MKKVTFLNAMTITAYCFCVIIFIIWASIAMAFALGYYTPKVVYAKNLSINLEENPNVTIVNNHPVLRINGITESENPNIKVDSTFIVNGGTEPKLDEDGNVIDENKVTETKIKLTSSNINVATVPEEANIGEPIEITVTKDENGVNKGGFCFINVQNDKGLFMQYPLVVFVDIPVTDLEVTSDNMTTIEEEVEDLGLVEKFVLYEKEEADVSTKFLPENSKDPSHLDTLSEFNKYRRDAKVVTYALDTNSPTDIVEVDYETGHIKALKAGEVTIIVKTLRTYDDIDFVNNYDSGVTEWGDYIPEEFLEGRYTTKSFIVKVEPVTLEAIAIDNRLITLPLFETKEFTVSDLGISLKASNGNNDYFASQLNDLILTSNSKELKIEKYGNKWQFTVVQDPMAGLSVGVSLENNPDLDANITEFEVTQDAISNILFEGTKKSNENAQYNDMIEISITKNGDVISSNNNTFDWTNRVEIVPENGKSSTTYKEVKVFAVGTYHNNSEYKDQLFQNEQGLEIVSLGSTMFAGFGREIRGEDLKNPKLVEALARGNIVLRAYVIKTDIDGNPIDKNGEIILFDSEGNAVDAENQVITTNIPTFVEIARSNEVTFKIIEKITDLETYVSPENAEGVVGEEQLIGTTSTSTSSKYLAVSSVSSHSVRLQANSTGALFDAFNNHTGNDMWIRVQNDDTDTLGISLNEINEGTSQTYYLNLDIHHLNPTKDYIEKNIKIEYYTGNTNISQDGYETLFTLRLYIVEVPVDSIKMMVNVDASETVETTDCYWVQGMLNYTVSQINSKQEVTSLSSQWGMIDNGVMSEIALKQPEFTAGSVAVLNGLIEGKDYLQPKPLVIANTAYTFSIHDANNQPSDVAELESITNAESETEYKIKIKELDKEFYITVTAAYQKYDNGILTPITDTICVKGNLTENAKNSIQWQMNEGTYETTGAISSLNLTELGGGYALRENALFQMKFVGSSAIGEDIWVSSESQFLQFEVCSDSSSKVRLIDGDRLVFANQNLDIVQANIYAMLVTSDGLKIKQQYTINFS